MAKLFCSAPQKKSKDITALGLANDSIKLFNLRTNQWEKTFRTYNYNYPDPHQIVRLPNVGPMTGLKSVFYDRRSMADFRQPTDFMQIGCQRLNY
jgi:hypothetical protein